MASTAAVAAEPELLSATWPSVSPTTKPVVENSVPVNVSVLPYTLLCACAATVSGARLMLALVVKDVVLSR